MSSVSAIASLRPAQRAEHDPRDENADQHADAGVDEEADDRLAPAERARHRGGDRRAIENERRRVVDEALALEHDDHAPRHGQPRDDRRRGDGVGRRDDRAERDRDGPGHPGKERARRDRDGRRRDEHESDGEQADRTAVRAEVAQRREERRRPDDRRQKDEEDEVRIELRDRHARHEPDEKARHDLQDRRRDRQPPRERRDGDDDARRTRARERPAESASCRRNLGRDGRRMPGERGTASGERRAGNGERGTASGERGR